ncbi:MAG: tRNA (adenosine(37)-N6)-dimethylallyltransferase MiaA [Clostridia bacterium]|nr:tRNA (adenosine(37)-N6)-dimethylallyltransferase MiaA [Clostridia bacterium]
MKKERIIAVAGPTASGKTAFAVTLAKKLGGEVISNDSMQIYRGMEIGTAAPTVDEMGGIPHHMIGIAEPLAEFSCADYAASAKNIIKEVISRKKVPIFCGGTGLYLDAVLKVNDFSASVKNDALREELSAFAEINGADALHERLRAVDPQSADAIHKNNVRRVIRAIEIFETTGITKTEWDKKSVEKPSEYDATVIVLDFLSRELLYSRIDLRVDAMMDAGLEAEVRSLWENGLLSPKKPAFQAIGYKEFIPYFEGKATLSETADAIKLATRRYAKRQITWFKRYDNAIFLHPDREDGTVKSPEELFAEAGL